MLAEAESRVHGKPVDDVVFHEIGDWDTLADARQFVDAYVSYADARFGHSADQVADGLACWQDDDVLCVTWEDDGVTVALGPEQAIVNRVLAEVP